MARSCSSITFKQFKSGSCCFSVVDIPPSQRTHFQSGDVELLHIHHRLHDALGGAIHLLEDVGNQLRNDLLREAVLVPQPAALLCAGIVSGAHLIP
jgi:hypothetical protein